MALHTIRLRGPWEAQAAIPEAESIRIPFPCSWKDILTRVSLDNLVLRRKFHAPTNLFPSDRVWLCISESNGELEVRLNGKKLGFLSSAGSWEVTQTLLPNNTLEFLVISIANMDGLAGEARLEIRSAQAND